MGTQGITDPNVEKMEVRLAALGAKLDTLVGRAEKAGDHIKADYRLRLGILKDQAASAAARLDEFKAAGSDTWDAFREGIETAWQDLEDSIAEIVRDEARSMPPGRAGAQRTTPRAPTKQGPAPKQGPVSKPPIHNRGSGR